MARHRPVLFALTILLLGGSLVGAEVWTVTMASGNTFESRYRPEPATWDSDITLLATDRGNWIGLRTDDIVDVISESEASGFGYRLDTTTLFLGWSPNDLVATDEDGNATPVYDAPALQQDNYSVEQFISVPVMGQSAAGAGGIPVTGEAGGGDE